MGLCCSAQKKSQNDAQALADIMKPLPIVKPIHNTFVELLIINRILFINESQQTTKINDITKDISNKNNKKLGGQVLSLIFKHGIKEYLSQYHISLYCNTIDIIFNSIIIQNYSQEYQQVLTNIKDNKDFDDSKHNYEPEFDDVGLLLSNETNLLPQIFQYLQLKELNSCSKVSFVWLIYAFDINAIYYAAIHNLPSYQKLAKSEIPFRVWQRFINIKSLDYVEKQMIDSGSNSNSNSNKLPKTSSDCKHFIRYFSLFENIQNLTIYFEKNFEMLEILSTNCNNILKFQASSSSPHKTIATATLSQIFPIFELPKAKTVCISNIPLPVLISNDCKCLHLSDIRIDARMYAAMISDKCDLSGIETIVLNKVDFDSDLTVDPGVNGGGSELVYANSFSKHIDSNHNYNYNHNQNYGNYNNNNNDNKKNDGSDQKYEKEEKLNTIVQKLSHVNLKKIEIGTPNSDIITFCKLLNRRIENGKNMHGQDVGGNINNNNNNNNVSAIATASYDYHVAMRVECGPEYVPSPFEIEVNGLQMYKDMIEFIGYNCNKTNNNSNRNNTNTSYNCKYLTPREITIGVAPITFELIKMIFESDYICDCVEMIQLTGRCCNIKQFLYFVNNMLYVSQEFPIKISGKLAKLLCIVCKIEFDQPTIHPAFVMPDWNELYRYLTLRGTDQRLKRVRGNSYSNSYSNSYKHRNKHSNIVDNNNSISYNYNSNSGIFWKLDINVKIQFGHAESVLDRIYKSMVQMWQNVNEYYIKRGKAIDFRICFKTYTGTGGSSHGRQRSNTRTQQDAFATQQKLIKIYENSFQNAFTQEFGDLVVVKDNNNNNNKDAQKTANENENGKRKYKRKYKVSLDNTYCRSLDVPQIWCSYNAGYFAHLRDLFDMQFVIRNVSCQNI